MATLKETRRKQFITQRELAAKAGVSLMTIIRLETGKTQPKFKTAKAIARVLKVKPQDIDWTIRKESPPTAQPERQKRSLLRRIIG